MEWKGTMPSITDRPNKNRVKVPIGSIASLIMGENTTSLDEEEEENKEDVKNKKLVGVVHSCKESYNI